MLLAFEISASRVVEATSCLILSGRLLNSSSRAAARGTTEETELFSARVELAIVAPAEAFASSWPFRQTFTNKERQITAKKYFKFLITTNSLLLFPYVNIWAVLLQIMALFQALVYDFPGSELGKGRTF